MSKLKVALSVVALLLLAVSGVTTFGSWSVSGPVSELLAAGAALLAWQGYQPIAVPPTVAKWCAMVGGILAGFVTSHAASWGDGGKHVALFFVSLAAAVLTSLGRGMFNRKPLAEVPSPAPPAPAP